MKSLRENILYYGSCCLVFILPLIYFGQRVYPHISSKTFFFYGSVEILAFLWIYSLIVDRSYRLPKKAWFYFLPLFAFLLWITLAGILAASPALSFWSSLARGTGLLTYYHIALFMLVIASLVHRGEISYVHKLMKWFIGGGFVLSLSVWFGSGGFNLPFKFLQTDGGGGLTGNSSLAAVYLMFILAFAVFLLTVKTISQKVKWLLGPTIAIIIFSPLFIDIHGFLTDRNLLGNARAVVLGIIVGVYAGAAGYWALSAKKTLRIIGVSGIAAGFIAFAFLWMQFIAPGTTLHQKFTEAATGTRFIFWDIASDAMQTHPWFGYGSSNFSIAFQSNFNPKMLLAENNHEVQTDQAHNIYYDIGVSGGYPAIVLYFLLLISIFYALYKKQRVGVFTRTQASIFTGLIVGYVFQNLFYFDSVLSLMVLFTTGGIVYGLQNQSNLLEKNRVSIKMSSSDKNGIALGLVLLFLVPWICLVYRPAQKATMYGKVFSMPINVRSGHYADLLEGPTVGEGWDVSGLADGLYKVYASDPIKTKNDTKLIPYALKDLNALLAYLENIAKENRTDYRLYMSMVHLYSTEIYLANMTYDPTLAKHLFDLLDHAHTLSPRNPEVYWGMAQVYAWSNDTNGVEQSYAQAIDIDPSIPASHILYLQFLQATGNVKAYQEALEKAKQDVPGFEFGASVAH